ncbi:MAG: PKD domain-containing protein [Candidatus Atribacteria bacterium]|nr:PKD domain-containing protein [Candidatus Atribacteria bacterium]
MDGRRFFLVFLLLLAFPFSLAQAQSESGWETHRLYHLTVKTPPGWYHFFGENLDELGGLVHPLWEQEPPKERERLFEQAEFVFVMRGETVKRFEADFRESDPSLTEKDITVGGYQAAFFETAQEGKKLAFAFVRSDPPVAFLFSLLKSGEKEVQEILQSVSIGDVPYRVEKILGTEILDFPQGVACDREGNVYVTTKDKVIVWNTRGEFLRTIEDKDHLLSPSGIVLDQEGNLYVADAMGRIQKFDREGKFLGTFVEGLEKPSGLACDREGNLYAAETGASRVTKLDREGKRVLTFGGPEELAFADAFVGVAVGGNGEIFVSDPGHNRILVFDSFGKVLRSIHRVPQVKGIYLASNDDFPQEPPSFTPTGLAVDIQGCLYVADKSSSSLLRFGKDDTLEVVWKRLEGQGFTFSENTLGATNGVAIDPSGVVYAARSVTPYALFGFAPTVKESPPSLRVVDIRVVPPPEKDLTPEEKQSPEPLPPTEKPEEQHPTETMPPVEETPLPETSPNEEEIPPVTPSPTFPIFTLTLTPQKTEFETGKNVRFSVTITPSPVNPVRYVWNFGDGTPPVTTDDTTTEHIFRKAGNIPITVKAFDSVTKEMLAMERVTLSFKNPGPELSTAEERYPSGKVKLRYTYYLGKNGQRIKHGPEVSFYENGKKKVEGQYEHGRKEGTWISYYDNGNIGQKGSYRNNLKEGIWTIYYRNGQKESEGPYHRDKREGKWTKWLPDGKKFAEMEYRSGEIVPGSYREF